MTTSLQQPSLSGGEISPSLFGRVDLAKYMNSLKACRNFIVQVYGGAKNRGGTRFTGEVKDSSKFTRSLPFTYSTEQAYLLEFGEGYVRVFRNGAPVLLSATPAAWVTSTVYAQADHVRESGINYYCVTPHTSGTFATDLAAGYWYALEANIVEFPTEWLEGDIQLLKTTQSADVLTVCHPMYKPINISRLANDRWTIEPFANEFGPFDDLNSLTTSSVYASAASGSVTFTSNGIFTATVDVGKLFYIEQKDKGQPWISNTAVALNDIRRANGKYWKALNAAPNCGYDRPESNEDNWHDGVVNWQFLHPGFGVAEITTCTTSNTAVGTVISRIPDALVGSTAPTYKWAKGIWNEVDGYPGCATYHQQRLFFGGSPKRPQTIWGSRTDDYTHFGKSSPVVDSDAVTYPLVSNQVNQVRHLVSAPGGTLLALTDGAFWSLRGSGENAPLTPSDVQAVPQDFRGSSDVPPLTVGNRILYVQEKGNMVLDSAFDFVTNSYDGDDLSELVRHMLDGHYIVSWCYQGTPFSVVWMVRDDGVLLGMTYQKKQQVIGWHRHDTTNGFFESCCTVTEGLEDVVYFVVRRVIDGQVRRYHERLTNRVFSDILDAFFVDSGLTYDGRNANPALSVAFTPMTSDSTWDQYVTINIFSNNPLFTGISDIGDEIVFITPTARYAATITEYFSSTFVRGVLNKQIPVEYRNVYRTDWAFARGTLYGMDHLKGQTIATLSEGNVDGPYVVQADGSFNLSSPSYLVHAGLPITADIETLDVAVLGGETVRDKKKLISEVGLQVASSRGIKIGPDADHLRTYKQRANEPYDSPVAMKTGMIEVSVDAAWDKNGGILIRQTDPLPVEILAIIPKLTIGGV